MATNMAIGICGTFTRWTVLLLFLTLCQCLLYCFITGQIMVADTSTDTGTSFIVYNHSLLLCQNAHRCGDCQAFLDAHQYVASACGCDDLCSWFDDCCYDLDMACATSNADGLRFLTNLAERQISRQDVTCVVLTQDAVQKQGVWMVSKCPGNREDSMESKKCHEFDGINIYDNIPVIDLIGIAYKNVYCAICHGMSTSDLTIWNLTSHCDNSVLPFLQNTLVGADDPFTEVLQLLVHNCTLSYVQPDNVGHIGNRSCVETEDIKQCVKGVDDSILDICNRYTAYILESDDTIGSNLFEGHRNPHCYQCSHGYLYNVMNCELDIPIVPFQKEIFRPPIPRDPTISIPLSALVNFNPNGDVTITVDRTVVRRRTVIECPAGAIYDPFSNRCRLLSCPEGSYLFGEYCIPSAESRGCSVSDVQFELMVIVNTSNGNFDQKDLEISLPQYVQTCLTSKLDIELTYSSSMQNDPYPRSAKNTAVNENIDNGSKVHIVFQLQIDAAMSLFDVQTIFDSLFISNTTKGHEPCNVLQATVSQTCLSLPNCSNINTTSEVSFITVNDTLYIFANATDRIYHILQQDLYLSYTRLFGNGYIGYRKMLTANICDFPLNCPLVTKKASEFQTINDTSDLLYIPSGMVLRMEEYQITTDGDVQLCSSFLDSGPGNTTEVISFVAYSRHQIIVTLVGYVTSMICEVVTFLTYCTFKSLRNRTSHSIMNLVCALFIGQFLLLVGGGRTQPAGLCTTVAVLLHYFFLSTFSWSSLLSFDLFQIFGANIGPVNVDGSRSRLLKHMSFAWSLPLLVVLPCIIIHYCACAQFSFQYGGSMSCWIDNEYANLLVFGLPIFISLLFNILNFCRTVWAIHRSKRNKGNRAPNEAARKKKYQELMIYGKIASLMGFTWIFAFIAALTGMEAFWYIYIVLNSFQGLYIFLAFICNKNVWTLWKRKLGVAEMSTKTNSTSNRNRSAGVAETPGRQEENADEIAAFMPSGNDAVTNRIEIGPAPSDTEI